MAIYSKTFDHLLANATILGTGFIPVKEDNWWFALGNEKYWKRNNAGPLQISFTAIGGYIEKGESFVDATLREIKEETGTGANLIDSDQTIFVTAILEKDKNKFNFKMQSIKQIQVNEVPIPYIMYTVKINNDILEVVVYKGEILSDPYPQMEVPSLLCLPPDYLLQTPKVLSELLELGCKIRVQKEEIPRDAILYPYGSATIIHSILKKERESKINH